MKAASVKEIKTSLEELPPAELLKVTLRLAKFKKENKELLTYLLFEALDERAYRDSVKTILTELFSAVNTKQLFIAKKNLRKILRTANRFIKYSDSPATEPEILIFVAENINLLNINLKKSTALFNLYNGLLKRINKAVSIMHEDDQYDYMKIIAGLII